VGTIWGFENKVKGDIIYWFIHTVPSVQGVNNQDNVTLKDVHQYYFIEISNIKPFCE
jgi:hypothetical protein